MLDRVSLFYKIARTVCAKINLSFETMIFNLSIPHNFYEFPEFLKATLSMDDIFLVYKNGF